MNIPVKNSNIPNDSADIINFHFSHYKSIETTSFHRQPEYLSARNKKNKTFCPPPVDGIIYNVCNMEQIGHRASFENVD